MQKKTLKYMIIAITLLSYFQNYAQIGTRRYTGNNAIEISLGHSDLGPILTSNFNHYFSDYITGKTGIMLEYTTYRNLKSMSLTIPVEAYFNIYQSQDNAFILNIGGGVATCVDFIDMSKYFESGVKRSSLSLGLIGGGEAEYYLSKNVGLIAAVKVAYMPITSISQFKEWATIGVRYNF